MHRAGVHEALTPTWADNKPPAFHCEPAPNVIGGDRGGLKAERRNVDQPVRLTPVRVHRILPHSTVIVTTSGNRLGGDTRTVAMSNISRGGAGGERVSSVRKEAGPGAGWRILARRTWHSHSSATGQNPVRPFHSVNRGSDTAGAKCSSRLSPPDPAARQVFRLDDQSVARGSYSWIVGVTTPTTTNRRTAPRPALRRWPRGVPSGRKLRDSSSCRTASRRPRCCCGQYSTCRLSRCRNGHISSVPPLSAGHLPTPLFNESAPEGLPSRGCPSGEDRGECHPTLTPESPDCSTGCHGGPPPQPGTSGRVENPPGLRESQGQSILRRCNPDSESRCDQRWVLSQSWQ